MLITSLNKWGEKILNRTQEINSKKAINKLCGLLWHHCIRLVIISGGTIKEAPPLLDLFTQKESIMNCSYADNETFKTHSCIGRRVYASYEGTMCAACASYLVPYDWPLWRWWLYWWHSGESHSLLPPWVKNGRCSAACGGWRHPAQAWSSQTMTGNTPQGRERDGAGERASNKEGQMKRKKKQEEE